MAMSSKNLLWRKWEGIEAGRVVLIDAVRGRSWTVRSLSDESMRFAEYLLSYATGERIAFRLPNGPEWLVLFLALQRAGLAAVPLDGGLPAEGCVETARRLGARAVYLDGEFHALGKARPPFKKYGCVKVTSGSDGLPNAVECRAEHLIADGEQIIATMKIRPGDRTWRRFRWGIRTGSGTWSCRFFCRERRWSARRNMCRGN
jgi:acyl-CoA synthetase (AMP-forming)/AMP-acid ligase II